MPQPQPISPEEPTQQQAIEPQPDRPALTFSDEEAAAITVAGACSYAVDKRALLQRLLFKHTLLEKLGLAEIFLIVLYIFLHIRFHTLICFI